MKEDNEDLKIEEKGEKTARSKKKNWNREEENILYNTLSPACSSYSSISAKAPLNSLPSLLELQQRHMQNKADGTNFMF